MPNVLDPVLRHAVATPEAIAIRDSRGNWTYANLLAAARSFASLIRRHGVAPGDRVLLVAPSVPEFIVAYLGIQAAGAVVVPMNTMSTRAEIGYVVGDSGAALVVAWHQLGPAAADAAALKRVQLVTLGEWHPASTNGGAEDDPTGEIAEREVHDTAAILYTSGTTGSPKGAELTVGNILDAGVISVEVRRSSPSDRFGTGLPLFHIYGQISVMMAALTAGASISLLSPFNASRLLELIRDHGITVVAGVPTMWNAALRAADGFGPADFSTVKIAISGGASLPAEISRAFEERFGCALLEGYGLTETASLATFADIDRERKIGWSGTAVPRTEIQLRTPEGEIVPPGQVGEIWVRGPAVMRGYWQRPDATAEVLRDGWFRTGDLAQRDDSGDIRIVDRLKDVIIRGGYNVYPGEVEAVLYTHPDIVEAAVVGVPDAYYGEEVAAMIVVRSSSKLEPSHVTAWARERMSAYKVPRIVEFADELPKGSTGKILKRSIRFGEKV